jgi:hypothetical protein
MSETLVEFLLARVVVDEAAARTAQDVRATMGNADGEMWVVTGADTPVGVSYDPAQVLAECQARRAIIELHRYGHECSGFYDNGGRINPSVGWASDPDPCDTLCLLAEPFKDHPDFSSEWLIN